jgi:hypothetical protein
VTAEAIFNFKFFTEFHAKGRKGLKVLVWMPKKLTRKESSVFAKCETETETIIFTLQRKIRWQMKRQQRF